MKERLTIVAFFLGIGILLTSVVALFMWSSRTARKNPVTINAAQIVQFAHQAHSSQVLLDTTALLSNDDGTVDIGPYSLLALPHGQHNYKEIDVPRTFRQKMAGSRLEPTGDLAAVIKKVDNTGECAKIHTLAAMLNVCPEAYDRNYSQPSAGSVLFGTRSKSADGAAVDYKITVSR